MPPRRGAHSTVIDHDDRARIEFQIARGVPVRVIAKRFGLSKDAVYRHAKKLPPQLKAAHLGQMLRAGADLEALRISESEGLLQNLAQQRARLLLAQDAAMSLEDHALTAKLANAIHDNLQLVGKYLGEFAQHQIRTSVSILIQPEYLALRAALLAALAPYHEARSAVAAALNAIETKAAQRPSSPMIEATATQVANA